MLGQFEDGIAGLECESGVSCFQVPLQMMLRPFFRNLFVFLLLEHLSRERDLQKRSHKEKPTGPPKVPSQYIFWNFQVNSDSCAGFLVKGLEIMFVFFKSLFIKKITL